jgi:hypothetical protein
LTKKQASAQRSTDESRELAIRQIISQAVVSESVVDIFNAVGLDKPNIGLLDEAFLAPHNPPSCVNNNQIGKFSSECWTTSKRPFGLLPTSFAPTWMLPIQTLGPWPDVRQVHL